MAKNIMLAFVSVVNEVYLKNPIVYPDIKGAPYSSIQTNESAVVYVERMLGSDSLSKIFFITSDKVKNDFVAAETEFGKIKHIDFLKRRILKEFPYLKDKFVEQDYSDDRDLEKNILQIAEIANAVTNYAKNFPTEKIIVHADMTGGFRHTSMLMLSIIQLLRYRGIEIGAILYSDPAKKIVYRANEIQKVFTLITGADEFVKFGSVEALMEYFEGNSDAATSKLLDAMKHFSETIKICRTADIEGDLKNLGEQIKIFRETTIKDIKSELFSKIIDTIEFEYGNLIKGKATRPDIIRWCMKKGFWQQAMTLCTEWLPEEIINRKIFEPTSELIIKDAENDGITFGREWQQHFIIAYQRKNKLQVDHELLNIFCRDLRRILKNLPSPIAEKLISKSYGNLKNLVDEHSRAYGAFSLCVGSKLSVNEFKKKYPLLFDALQFLYKERPCKKKFFEYLRTLDYDKIFAVIADLRAESLLGILNIDKINALNIVLKKLEENAAPKWENRAAIYREMLKNGVARSKITNQEEILKLLNGYYEIRQERNRLNHANNIERKEISDLEKMIVDYLNELEKI